MLWAFSPPRGQQPQPMPMRRWASYTEGICTTSAPAGVHGRSRRDLTCSSTVVRCTKMVCQQRTEISKQSIHAIPLCMPDNRWPADGPQQDVQLFESLKQNHHPRQRPTKPRLGRAFQDLDSHHANRTSHPHGEAGGLQGSQHR